jgi:hypothetical protein
MTIRKAAAALVTVLLLVGCSWSCDQSSQPAPQSSSGPPTSTRPNAVGSVTAVQNPIAKVGNQVPAKGDPIYEGQDVTTDPDGAMLLNIGGLANCRMLDSAALTIAREDLLTVHMSGFVSCNKAKGNQPLRQIANVVRIVADDPVWTVIQSPGSVVVRVVDGSVTVQLVTQSKPPVQVAAGQQVTVTDAGVGDLTPFSYATLPAPERAGYGDIGLNLPGLGTGQITDPKPNSGLASKLCQGDVNSSCTDISPTASFTYTDGKAVPPERMRWTLTSGGAPEGVLVGPGTMTLRTAHCGISKSYQLRLEVLDEFNGSLVLDSRSIEFFMNTAEGKCPG